MFDKNYKLLDAAWEAVDPAANQVGATPVIAHDYLMREYTAKEEGYVFMYVSNENATLVYVYFDDVVMTHTKTNVIQYNEYYPFGMNTANSWTRENTTGNNFLANGGTELNAISNLYDLDHRNYDPILGRMNGIDPMATKYASLSPYNFSFNDPVAFSDPSGADPYQRSDDTWWVASRTSLYGSRYSGFSSPGDLANQNPSFDLSTNPWAWTGMSNGAIYGPSFSMEGVGSAYGSIAHQQYVNAIEQAKEQGGRVEFYHGQYWVSVPLVRTFIVETPDDPNYSGYSVTLAWPGREDIFVMQQQQTQGGGRFFGNEGDAYKYMWNSSFDADGKVQQEVAGFLTPKGVLVLPIEGTRTNGEYAKNGPRKSYSDFLPLSRKDGNLFVTFNGTNYQVLGQVHTHPNAQPFGRYEVTSDLVTQGVLGVPVYMMRTNGFYDLNGTMLGAQQDFINGTISLIGGK